MKLVEGKTGSWEVVIGLEVHAQIISNTKLFSGAPTGFGAEPNAQVSFVDAAFPGMLPVLNRVCVEQAVRTGLGLNAEINLTSVFERKNYFYQDLPAGYQISQYLHPIVGKGQLKIELADGETKMIGITRLHLEQDAGKSLHDQHPNRTYIDLNRAGVALMEIVSEPDIRSPEEAGAYVRKLRSILRYIGSCDGNMEQGNLRCDVNISVRRPGAELGTRCEIKNVNSVRFVMQSIDYEVQRQIEVIESGGSIAQETRLFDPTLGTTRTMRTKEDAHDYRYFPDPDLLPLRLTEDFVAQQKAKLPELPDQKKERFVKQYNLPSYDADFLTAERELANFYEETAKDVDGKLAANWVMGDFSAAMNKSGGLDKVQVTAKSLNALVKLIGNGTISGRMAKDVFIDMLETGKDPESIVNEKGMVQVSDTASIEKLIDDVLVQNQDKVAEYRSGKDKLFGFFVGQTMKASQGKANPQLLNELLLKKLQG
ncbi:MAG: Asp-tRNA(Asn)/Glu-tRNA(Gln) amidotransferase subunit GatB [Alphaproteobacteria bacterium]|nr:Asp-tRNA(Asn)/Glu-tRNA(Gln) amidotransferase subunit GatB [Alphaproteobacteria bacterium]